MTRDRLRTVKGIAHFKIVSLGILSAAITLALAIVPATLSSAAPNSRSVAVSITPTKSGASTLTANVTVSHAPSHVRGVVYATLYGPVTSSSCQGVSAERFKDAPKKRVVGSLASNGRATVKSTAPKGTGCYAWGATVTFAGVATASVAPSGKSTIREGSTTAQTAPSSPTNEAVTFNTTTATISWNAPSSDGGSSITGYTVTAIDLTNPSNGGEICVTTGALSCNISELTSGDTYAFTITAANSAGSSAPAIGTSTFVVPGGTTATTPPPGGGGGGTLPPSTVSDAPMDVTASAQPGSVTVDWTAPASDGGSPITGYTATATDTTNSANGGETCTTTGATTCTFYDLTVGDEITFSVTATNADGTSSASTASSAVTVAEMNAVVDTISTVSEPEAIYANPADTYAYVLGDGSDTIDVIDMATNTVTDTIDAGSAGVGDGPSGLTINAAGTYAYAPSQGSDLVDVIDLATNTVTDTIDAADGALSVQILPNGTTAWVTTTTDVVYVLDLSTNTITGSFDIPFGSPLPVFNSAGTYGYTTNNSDTVVYLIDVATSTVTTSMTVGTEPDGVTANPADTLGYVANYGSDTVSVINFSTNTVVDTIDVGEEPNGVTFNSAGTYAYVTNGESDTVSVIDVATNTVAETIDVGSDPEGFNFNNAGTMAYVINESGETVSVIDLATDTVTATVTVGSEPNGVFMSSDGDWGYVYNMGSNTVTAINLSTNATTTIPVGSEPINAVLNAAGTYMYLENFTSGTVSVIALG